ncbi:MAG: sirohydrochlorin cobaltochelatase [Candidatus Adiutrix sp.]
MFKFLCFSTLFFIWGAVLMINPKAAGASAPAPKAAIVLAAFGTTDVEALEAILNVQGKVKEAFPQNDVFLAFTSNIIRKRWSQRNDDLSFKQQNNVPDFLYTIKHPLTVLALIQESGPRPILVQSLHITNGSEFGDLKNIINQLAAIEPVIKDAHLLKTPKKPFPYLALGDSALGAGHGPQLERAALALKPLVELAKQKQAALVLMGHGNDHVFIKSYNDLAETMHKLHDYPVFMGLVEGSPDLPELIEKLNASEIKKVMLAPFMLVAGDHAKNDMASDDDDSWATVLQNLGFEVTTHVKGLGLIDAWANIYVENLQALEAEYLAAQ